MEENPSATAILATLGNYKSTSKVSDKQVEDFMAHPKTTPNDVVELLKTLGHKVYDTAREIEMMKDVLGRAIANAQSGAAALDTFDKELMRRDRYRDNVRDTMDKMTLFIHVATVRPWQYQYWPSLRRDHPRLKDPSVYEPFINKLKGKNGKAVWLRLPRVVSTPYEFSWKTIDSNKICEYVDETRLEES